MIGRDFFRRSPLECSRDLIGAILRWGNFAGNVVETEAYDSEDDPACHTFFRPSTRKFVAMHDAGAAYVYLNYGMHWLFNVLVKSDEGSGFVLLRAVEPMFSELPNSIAAGPGKLTRFLGIDGSVHGSKFLETPQRGITRSGLPEVVTGRRIGISKAKELPWRFGDPASPALSRPFESA